MAREESAHIGSGTIPFTRGILTEEQRGTNSDGKARRRGSNVIVINPEDINSVDAFAASGITVGTTTVQILAPGTNPLPRSQRVTITNYGSNDLFLGHNSTMNLLIEGYPLKPSAADTIPQQVVLRLLHNVEIWARTDTGTTDVRMLIE